MSLFRLDASINPATSQSRVLADLVEAEWTAGHPGSLIVRRDIGTEPSPTNTRRDVVTSGAADDAAIRPAQRQSRALATTPVDELIDADAVVLATLLGGDYRPGGPKEGWDHSTSWLRHVIEVGWGAELLVVQHGQDLAAKGRAFAD